MWQFFGESMIMNNQIEIYKTPDGNTEIEVQFDKYTVWLNQNQITELFLRDRTVITKHINNVFNEGELDKKSNMHFLHIANSDKPVAFYNLDVIISVGYRVKSKRGTQFRQWATSRLKEYLVDGYAINQKRLEERNLELQHLKTGIAILRRAIAHQAQSLDDAEHLAGMLERFSGGLSLLDDYDHETLDVTGKTKRKAVIIDAADYQK
jgi:hypothetical protein